MDNARVQHRTPTHYPPMTIQLYSIGLHGRSKRVLEEALNTDPAAVKFHNPSIFLAVGEKPFFTGADIPDGKAFAIVMDHPKRSKFAQVKRLPSGKFRVS